MSERTRKVDVSLGEIQCPYLTPNGDDGVLCCALVEGHEGPHMTCYEVDGGWRLTPRERWYLPAPAAPEAPSERDTEIGRTTEELGQIGGNLAKMLTRDATDQRLREALNISPDEVGRIMHESWSRTKREQGFHHPIECDLHKLYTGLKPLNTLCRMCHMDLVPWEKLPDKQKDINRHAFDAVLEEIKRRAALGEK